MTLRRLFAIIAVLLLAAQVVRHSAVMAYAELRPDLALRIWPGHPAVETSVAMLRIATAARQRRTVDPSAFAMIDDVARKSPLSAEPFLVRGVEASVSGHAPAASRAFLAAQRREPRSMAAAYFLADYDFRTGKALQGLLQAALLARLSPGGTGAVGQSVAVYAQNPASWPELRALFRTDETIEDDVLAALAADPRNATAILAIADRAHRSVDSRWLGILLQSLVRAGDYERARDIWASVSRIPRPTPSLYDAAFTNPAPPPPFNWTLASSTLGIAERQRGSLHVIYYGEDDGVLASQLLLLGAGRYRLLMKLGDGSAHADMLSWSLRCDHVGRPFASIPLPAAAAGGWVFDVPQDCPAQWLELSGRSADMPQQAEAVVGPLTLQRTGGA